MSVEAMALVLHHSAARGAAKLVLLGIANHEGDGGSWPAIKTLGKYAGGIDDRSVRRILRQLENSGEIATNLREGGDRDCRADQRPNRYRILLRCPDTCDGTTRHRDRTEKSGRKNEGTPVSGRPRTKKSGREGTDVSPKSSSKPSTNQPAASGGVKNAAPARETRERLVCEEVFGLEWQQAWSRYLPEDRAMGILIKEGIDDADQARRIIAEWAAAGARGFQKGPDNALIWACRNSTGLVHTAAGDERLPVWAP